MRRGIGIAVFMICGIVMFVFEIIWFTRWWGGVGTLIGFFVPPVAAFFPFIYLFKEGFSLLYFGLWGLGIIAMGFGFWGDD